MYTTELYKSQTISHVYKTSDNGKCYDRISAGIVIDLWYIRGTRTVHTEFWYGNLRERDHFENVGVDMRIILKWALKTLDEESLTGLIWLRIGTSGGLCVSVVLKFWVP